MAKTRMSRERAQLIRACGLRPFFYTVMDECRDFLMIRHRITGECKILLKEGMKKAASGAGTSESGKPKNDGAILAQKWSIRND